MGRSRRLMLVAGLLAALLPAVVAAVGPQPGAPCEPALLAAQVALFCAPGMATALCCEPVVAAVDLGVPCVCRVAAEPQLVTAGLDVTHLLKTYGSCGGLLPGVAHLSSAACEGPAPPAAVVSSPPPPSPAPGRKQAAREAPRQPLASEKPSSRAPQEDDGAAPNAKPVPTPPATSPPAAPENATAPSPPPQERAAVNISRIIGYICTSVLYMSPIPMMFGICKTGDVGQHKIDVFIVTFTSCLVWVLYGVSTPFNRAMVIVNGVGAFVEGIYIGIFVWNSSAVGRMWAAITLVLIGGILGFTAAGIFSSGSPNLVLAILADASSFAMYLAPIRQMMAMWNAKVVHNSSFAVAAASILNGACWTVYAALKHHRTFLLIPNAAGILAGIAQLGFFLVVRFKYQQQQQPQ